MYRHFDLYDNSYTDDSIRILSTPSEFASENFLYVQECGKCTIKTTKKTARNGLNSFLIVYVKKGNGTLGYNGKNYELDKNDIFFIDCNKYHVYTPSKDNPWSLVWVHFNGRLADFFYKEYENNFDVVTKFEKSEEILNYLFDIINTNKDSSYEILQNANLCNLLTLITTNKKASAKVIDSVVAYINAHFTEKIALDDISAKFFISKYHLSRQLKKQLGVGFSEYITSKRLDYAKEILRFSDKSIEEIAYMAGFSTPSHFISKFKKSEKITPNEFRKRWIE